MKRKFAGVCMNSGRRYYGEVVSHDPKWLVIYDTNGAELALNVALIESMIYTEEEVDR